MAVTPRAQFARCAIAVALYGAISWLNGCSTKAPSEPDSGVTCQSHADCGTGQGCVEGQCLGQACLEGVACNDAGECCSEDDAGFLCAGGRCRQCGVVLAGCDGIGRSTCCEGNECISGKCFPRCIGCYPPCVEPGGAVLVPSKYTCCASLRTLGSPDGSYPYLGKCCLGAGAPCDAGTQCCSNACGPAGCECIPQGNLCSVLVPSDCCASSDGGSSCSAGVCQ
jgi:hypothetical protein